MQTESEIVGGLWTQEWLPPERLSVSGWTEKHFRTGANKEPLDLDRAPWLREFLDCASDYTCEEQLFLGSPQVSGKTVSLEAIIAYYVANDPADLRAYTRTMEMAKDWAEKRLLKIAENVEPVRALLPAERTRIRTTEILFAHMVLEVAAANESNLQSVSRRIVVCDERMLWEAGAYEDAKRRTSAIAFNGRRKMISASNSAAYEADVELQWRTSDQRVWHACCPQCGHAAPFKFSEKKCRRVPDSIKGFTLKWEESSVTKPGGRWAIDEVVKTVRLVCPHCRHEMRDEPRTRVLLNRSGHYVPLNPHASAKSRAWAVSGVANHDWGYLVRNFLLANEALSLGDIAPMRKFVERDLNEPWSEDGAFEVITRPEGDYAETGEPWDETAYTAMTVDVQELAPYFWYIVQDWAADGRSRLRRYGSAMGWAELREIQQREGIPNRYVHVDSGHKPGETYEQCCRYGWLALKGTDEKDFVWPAKGLGKKPVRRYFSQPRWRDPGLGTKSQNAQRAVEYLWANEPIKDLLDRLYRPREGQHAVYYGVPRDVRQEFLDQMSSETKKVVATRGAKEIKAWRRIGKRPNHLWDCAAMQLVFASIRGLLARAAVDDETPDGELRKAA